MSKKTLVLILSGIALAIALGALVAYWVSGEISVLSGGGVSVFLAALAAKLHDQEKKELLAKHAAAQKTGAEALAGADNAIKEMEDVEEGILPKSPEDLTKTGNDLFGGGSK